jgi:hypothetical protein
MFSGLNLALFGINRLHLEVEVATGNISAGRILAMREDSNLLLTTILWGNVGINVLLTLLADSVMTGVVAFLFSTIVITLCGEIAPQAYFSRNALRMGALFQPLMKTYQTILYPVAKPSAMLLDLWLGKEGIEYFREKNMREVIRKHIASEESDIDRIEGIGALNFLAFDDLMATQEGEPVALDSIIELPMENGKPVFPVYQARPNDAFLRQVNASGKKWIIIVDHRQEPQLVLNANSFLRATMLRGAPVNPYNYSHKPIVVRDPQTLLGAIISKLKVYPNAPGDDVIDEDLILVWGPQRRVITGADILGRLLRGIAIHNFHKTEPNLP